MTRERRLERIWLKPLAWEEALGLIGSLAGLAPDSGVAAAIYREASGNPFFLEAMVRHLQSEGHSLDKPETAVSACGIPEDLRQVINHRLSRLSTATNRLLHAAAVLDAEFDLPVIGKALDLTPGAVTECVEEALNAGLVVTEACLDRTTPPLRARDRPRSNGRQGMAYFADGGEERDVLQG